MELNFQSKMCYLWKVGTVVSKKNFVKLSSIMAFTSRKSKQILLRLKGANFPIGRSLLIINFLSVSRILKGK